MRYFLLYIIIFHTFSSLFSQSPTLPRQNLQFLVKDSSLLSGITIDEQGIKLTGKKPGSNGLPNYLFIPKGFKSSVPHYFDNAFDGIPYPVLQSGTFKIDFSNKYSDRHFAKDSLKPLNGIKIALDPGHVGGDLETAKMEGKFLEIASDSIRGILNTTIIEGKLTYATAIILKKMLEEKGAIVMITRSSPEYSSFGISFEEWEKLYKQKALDTALRYGNISKETYRKFLTANKKTLFRDFFLQEDLRERARLINRFKPDLTIIIHYNVNEKNKNWTAPTDKNFCMVFVPGGFRGSDLDKPTARFEFARLLLTDDLQRSLAYGSIFARKFREVLKVPLATCEDAGYLLDDCTLTPHEGVFCRNLALTRLIHGPLVYGETLYQDNWNEYKLLSVTNFENGNIPYRVKQVAQAYFEGVLEAFK